MQFAEAIEEATGKPVSDARRAPLTRATDELALVRSGLDDSMRGAFQEMLAMRPYQDGVHDYRTAAYMVAVERISRSYLDVGVY